MLGRIISVTKTRKPIGDKLTRTLSVHGEELGADLVRDTFRNIPAKTGTETVNIAESAKKRFEEILRSSDAGVSIEIAVEKLGLGEAVDRAKEALETLAECDFGKFILNALKRLPSLQIEIDFLGEKRPLGDFIRIQRDIPSFETDSIINPRPKTYQGNSLLNLLRDGIDEQFYEIFWDTVVDENGMPSVSLIIRPRPFDRLEDSVVDPLTGLVTSLLENVGYKAEKAFLWENLRTRTDPNKEHHVVTEDQVLDLSLGVSSDNVFTAYTVGAGETSVRKNQDAEVGIHHPIIDFSELKKFGYRELLAVSRQVEDRLGQNQSESAGVEGLEKGQSLVFSESEVADFVSRYLGIDPKTISASLASAVNEVEERISGFLDRFDQSTDNAIEGVLEKIPGIKTDKLKEIVDEAKFQLLSKIEETAKERVQALLGIAERAETRTWWKANRLHNWNRLNPWFESGSVKIIGREAIHVGERVFLQDEAARDGARGLEGYITGVTHTWGYGGSFETQLAVERCITETTRQSVLKKYRTEI